MIFFPFALAIVFSVTSAALTGSGNSSRIWNCCKPSCAWEGKANVTSPVAVCNKDNSPLNDLSATSACTNGTAYGCADQAPWQVDKATAYGYSAVVITGQTESDWCCACFELTFTSGPAQGRKMTIQAVDTLPDMGVNQFSLSVRTTSGPIDVTRFSADREYCRFRAAVLAPPTPARDSMGCLHQAGVKNTAVYPPCPLATVTRLRSRRAANGALIGSEGPTTQGEHIYLYSGILY